MVNLNNIFNKFFPKATTSPTGKKLIYMAWAIEITVALVGFSIAGMFVLSGREEAASVSGQSLSSNMEYYIIGLAFFVVGIMELTKIPLATALYYAAKTFWKIVFLFALLAVNFSTFETIIQGFELAYNQRSKSVDLKRAELDKLRDQLQTIDSVKISEQQIDQEILVIQNRINELNQSIANIKSESINQIAQLENQNAAANPKRELLAKQIESAERRLEKLEDAKRQSVLSLQNIKEGILNKQTKKREAIQTQINNYDRDIEDLKRDIENKRNELNNVSGNIASQNRPRIEAIKKDEALRIENIQKQIIQITNEQLKPKENEKSRLSDQETINNEEKENIQKLIDEKRAEVIDLASNNQIYRLALMIKIGPGQWFFDEKIEGEITEAELTQEDIDTAFWLWFGFLAFIISIIGTLVAFAGLHLMDERMHEIRNQPLNRRNTLRYRFAKFFVVLTKYFSASIKSKLKPKIVEKIVEKEVKVEVDRPVYEEKIVYQKVEVPKEVTRKEIVHVPLWTQDPDLLSKKLDPSFIEKATRKKK